MRQLNKKKTLAGLIVTLVAGPSLTGCQQPTGPGMAQPILPANPMSGPTRIPPPPTGSIGGSNSYVTPPPIQGQVSAGLPVNDLVAAAVSSPPVPSGGAVGSGRLAMGPNAKAMQQPAAPVQQVDFQSSPSVPAASQGNDRSVGAGLAPTIPAEAIVGSSYVENSAPLRPQLRGMEPIDLTPTDPPTLRQVDSGSWAVVGESSVGNAGSLPSTRPFQSVSPQTEPVRTASRSAGEYQQSGTSAAAESSLQWRRPQVAR